jgi:hypothetical protein
MFQCFFVTSATLVWGSHQGPNTGLLMKGKDKILPLVSWVQMFRGLLWTLFKDAQIRDQVRFL